MLRERVLILLTAVSLVAVPAYGQASMEPRSQGGITYISGGIGLDDMEMLRELRPEYNLHLLFAAQGSGQYLADVTIQLQDAKGRTLLDAVADGPYFYAKVAPGRYKILAQSQGITLTKSIEVTGKGPVSESFYWPAP